MVKAGIYIVARFTPIFGGDAVWFYTVSFVGLITLFWGAFSAIRETDLKALLAYSTISQLGLIMSLFGVSSLSLHSSITINHALYTQAAFAALFHLVNHSTFKGALFMIVGILDFKIGTRDIRRLGGLMVFMPVSFSIALIGSFSMAGLPPFNGFLSKEMFFTVMLNVSEFNLFSLDSTSVLFPVIAWIASIFTFIYSMIIVFKTFLGKPKEKNIQEAKEASFGMLLAPSILAISIIVIFLFPNILADNILRPALASIYPNLTNDYVAPITAWHGFNTELFLTIGVVVIGSVIFAFYRRWNYIYKLFPKRLSFDALYNNSLIFFDRLAKTITTGYMTGYLRNYFQYIFISFVLLIGFALFKLNAFSFNLADDTPVGIFQWILAITIIIAGITMIMPSVSPPARSRWRRIRQRYRISARAITMTAAGLVSFGLLVPMLLVPVPYAVEASGPTFNTLGEVADHPLISIDGADTYPDDDGQLRLTTVTTAGGPAFPVTAGSVLRGWLSSHMLVQPAEAVFRPDITEEERSEVATQQMASSQQNATVAALTEHGYEVPATLTEIGSAPDSDAHGVVQADDVITALTTPSGEHTIETYQDLSDALAVTTPGSTLTMTVARDGAATILQITAG